MNPGPTGHGNPSRNVRMIGVRFHPHTAGQLLKIPMCELTNAAVSIDDISGRLFRELQELEEPRSPPERFAALDHIMLALGKRAGGDDGLLSAAVQQLEAAGGSTRVAVVADHAGLSGCGVGRRRGTLRILRSGAPDSGLPGIRRETACRAAGRGYRSRKAFYAMRAHVAFFQDTRGHFSLNCGEVVKGEAMKNSGMSRGVLLILLAVGLGRAQQAEPTPTLQEEVVAQERAGLDALKIGDLTAFANSLPDDAVFVDAHGAAGKDEVVKNVAGFRLTEYTMTDVRFVALSADSGLIVYRLAESGTSHGKEFAAKVHVSSLWLRRGGKWMCVFSQETGAR